MAQGLGLSADPNYSILNETLPYISRRILTDPDPRMGGALGMPSGTPAASRPSPSSPGRTRESQHLRAGPSGA